ncbi:hypothetical protein PG995_012355 [Apiospora arundinis]
MVEAEKPQASLIIVNVSVGVALDLTCIAEHGRGLNRAGGTREDSGRAGGVRSSKVVEGLGIFRKLTDLYGQIYLIRDMAARVR